MSQWLVYCIRCGKAFFTTQPPDLIEAQARLCPACAALSAKREKE